MVVYNCYTDASTIESSIEYSSGLSAILVNITDNRILKSIGQTKDIGNCTHAELSAINLGLVLAKTVADENDFVRIVSDSLSAIELIESDEDPRNEVMVSTTRTIRSRIDNFPCRVELQWVRSHSEHPINDMADYIAYRHAQG